MKKLLIALTTTVAFVGPAAAQDADTPRIHVDQIAVASGGTEWEANVRRCEMDKWFYRGKDAYEFSAEGAVLVSITPADVTAIEKGLEVLKKCDKFWTCVRERNAGSKKHCYLPRR